MSLTLYCHVPLFNHNPKRRSVLASIGASGIASVAGCTSVTGDKSETETERGRGRSGRSKPESTLVARGVDRIEQTLGYHLEQEIQHGAQLAVYHDGEIVVDTAGGVAGPDREATTTGTRHVLFSCTKPYAAACVHLLADRDELDYEDRIVDHWPTFADEGTEKAEVTVRQVLSHQAGLSQVPLDDEAEKWTDPDAIAASVEDADLVYSPGERAEYHILSFGWLTGELVRQVTGTRIDRFACEELFRPLGMNDTFIGLPEDEPDDVATLVGFEPYDQIDDPDPEDAAYNAEVADSFNSEFVQRAIVPGANGIGTAGDMVRFYACLLNGGKLEGTRLFHPKTVAEWTSLEAEVESDPIRGGAPGRFSLGFFLGGLVHDSYGVTAPPSTYGHGGLGSSMGWADPENDIAFAYVTNGIRDGYEQTARQSAMADTVRHELS